MTDQEKLIEQLKKEYFKDLPEDEKERMAKLIQYMMIN